MQRIVLGASVAPSATFSQTGLGGGINSSNQFGFGYAGIGENQIVSLQTESRRQVTPHGAIAPSATFVRSALDASHTSSLQFSQGYNISDAQFIAYGLTTPSSNVGPAFDNHSFDSALAFSINAFSIASSTPPASTGPAGAYIPSDIQRTVRARTKYLGPAGQNFGEAYEAARAAHQRDLASRESEGLRGTDRQGASDVIALRKRQEDEIVLLLAIIINLYD